MLRRAVAEYLQRRRKATIAAQYRKAYCEQKGLGAEFSGWEDEGQWPPE